MALRVSVLAAVVCALAGCGGSHVAHKPGFRDCADAWNARDNDAHRQIVAQKYVPAGYTNAGIQMSLTLGTPMMGPDPNPVGCRVVFFNRDRWIAYLAHRNGDHFRFRAWLPPRRDSDQRGAWPKRGFRGPNNATIVGGGRIALRA